MLQGNEASQGPNGEKPIPWLPDPWHGHDLPDLEVKERCRMGRPDNTDRISPVVRSTARHDLLSRTHHSLVGSNEDTFHGNLQPDRDHSPECFGN